MVANLGFYTSENFVSFRSFDRIILNILSFEKDLLRLKKDERIMKSIRMLLKFIVKTRLKFFLVISGKNSYSLTILDPKQMF